MLDPRGKNEQQSVFSILPSVRFCAKPFQCQSYELCIIDGIIKKPPSELYRNNLQVYSD